MLNNYLKFLKVGSDKWPKEAFEVLGINLEDKEVYENAIKYFEENIKLNKVKNIESSSVNNNSTKQKIYIGYVMRLSIFLVFIKLNLLNSDPSSVRKPNSSSLPIEFCISLSQAL